MMDNPDNSFIDPTRQDHPGLKTTRSLTIKQLVSSQPTDSSPIVDNSDVSNVLLCGHIVSVRSTSAGRVFELDDTTARIDCAFWASSSYDDLVSERIIENNLIRVLGSIKIFNSKMTVNVNSIQLIATNQLLYHLSAALYQSLHHQHRLADGASSRPAGTAAIGGDMPAIQKDILHVYRTNQDENGLELNTVIAMLRARYSEPEIRDAVDTLMNNCYIYYVDGECYRTVS